MFCHQCGNENENQSGFCYHCGVSLHSTNPEVPIQPASHPNFTSYAGFWKRFAACLIDGIITNIAGFIFGFFIGFFDGFSKALGGVGLGDTTAINSVFSLIVGWLYFSIMESSDKQATIGKMALGIIVTDTEGKRISFGRATGRYFSKIISALILLIGFIMAGFTKKKQALHDIIANSLVINKPRNIS